jgi:hypothetical protein
LVPQKANVQSNDALRCKFRQRFIESHLTICQSAKKGRFDR